VPFDLAGITAGDVTEGHRFMAPQPFTVSDFDSYETGLSRAHVLLSAEARADKIRHEAETLAFAQGLEIVDDPGLLREVAGLVEWPVVLLGRISAPFLELPPEVLQTSMREHQKFLSVRNPSSGQIEGYIVVANRETEDQGATILAGNAKVLAARLSDAVFFWENDLRRIAAGGMAGMAAPLTQVTFHNRLGTEAARVERITALAATLAPQLGADVEQATTAASVAKADLASEMVYEFPELQGTMGRYYALHAGLSQRVADAIAQHYAPLGPSDAVPSDPVAMSVALADKLDMLAGFWSIGETPTGSRDPFALRRAALGVLRLLTETGTRLALRPVLAGLNTPKLEAAALDDLMGFLADRLTVHLRAQGVRHDVLAAALPLDPAFDPVLLAARVAALQAFLDTEEGANLVAGFKRANNILVAEERRDGVEYSLDPVANFAEPGAEAGLFAALDRVEADLAPALAAEDFARAMTALATLRAPIDTFFDDVTVNSERDVLRRNRLCLLHRVRSVMADVAQLDALEG
ncbi:MAG: glycine--tRNA ligase subunit beta, partial [Pseudomonadota bacterium]